MGFEDGVVLDVAGFHGGLDQLGRHQMVVLANLNKDVFQVGIQAGGHVGGQGPGGGGPDHDPGPFQRNAILGQNALGVAGQLEADVDGVALILGILDLRLGQRGAIFGAPVYSLHALVDIALLGHLTKDLHLAGLKLRAQSQVGVVEVALHTQTFELFVHHINVLGGKLAADAAQFQLGNAGLFVPQGAQCLELDGQTMGIIAGHIGGAVALHVLATDDDILDNLIQSSAHMDAAVGIRRAVMQDEAGMTLIVADHLLVDMVLLPVFQHFGFLFGQAGPHFEGGRHLMNGVVVILRQNFLLSSIKRNQNHPQQMLQSFASSGQRSAVKIYAGKGIQRCRQILGRLGRLGLLPGCPGFGAAAAPGCLLGGWCRGRFIV